MAAFEYKALDPRGRQKSGVMEGDSARQVRQLLREQGLTPLEVNETTEKAKREANAGLDVATQGPAMLPPPPHARLQGKRDASIPARRFPDS